MGAIRTFRDLVSWQVAMELVEHTYTLTADFPDSERYGLSAQMRRASVSVPSNIAEGHGVRAPRWSLRHVNTAIGSTCELETQLEVALRLRFVTAGAARSIGECLDRTQKLLYGMRREKQLRIGGASVGAVVLAVGMLHALL